VEFLQKGEREVVACADYNSVDILQTSAIFERHSSKVVEGRYFCDSSGVCWEQLYREVVGTSSRGLVD